MLSDDTMDTTASASDTQPVSAAVSSTCAAQNDLLCRVVHAHVIEGLKNHLSPVEAPYLGIHWMQWQSCHASPKRLAEIAFRVQSAQSIPAISKDPLLH
jgi:hypothetical protein